MQTADCRPIAHEGRPGNVGEAATLLPTARSLLERRPLKRVVLAADRRPLNLNDLQEIEKLQTPLDAQGSGVQVLYVLAVPAARDDEFHGGRLHGQDAGNRRKGRSLPDSGAKARLYHAVKDARLAHPIKVDVRSELVRFSIDDKPQRPLERLDGKLLMETNTEADAAAAVARHKSLARNEQGFRRLKSDIEIAPIYHRLRRCIRALALVCFLALIPHRLLRMQLKQSRQAESPSACGGGSRANINSAPQHRMPRFSGRRQTRCRTEGLLHRHRRAHPQATGACKTRLGRCVVVKNFLVHSS